MTAQRDAATRFIGASVKRREDRRLVTGHGTYVDDVSVPHMLHAVFVRSPIARALVTAVDVAEARSTAGVHAVLTLDDLDEVRDPDAQLDLGLGPTRATKIAAPLTRDSVQHVGEPVAVVVAESRAIAEDAAELIMVDYEPLTPVIDPEDALADPEGVAGPDRDDFVLPPIPLSHGDPEGAFEHAATVFTETVHQHRYLTVPMETRGALASWDGFSQEMTIWISTQGPHMVRDHMAAAMGIDSSRVRVIVRDVGGGFGLKLFVGREETATVLAARYLGRPVKWIEDRWENLVAADHARADHATVSYALDDEARILAITADHVSDVGAYGNPDMGIARLIGGPYRVRHQGGSSVSVRTNTSTRGAYRGPWMFETVARETVLDMVARHIGMDPLELRRRNVIQPDDLPFSTPSSQYDDVTPAATLEQAAELIDYDAFRDEQAVAREEGRHLGVGIALFVEQSALGYGPAVTEAVTLRVDHTGKVQLITGASSQGHSIETTMPQVVAEHLGVDVDDIVFLNGDTGVAPYGPPTGGSRNAVFGGGASRQAALDLRDKVVTIASEMMEVAAEDLEIERGEISVRGAPARSVTLADVARRAFYQPALLPSGVEPGLEVTSRYTTGGGITWSNAAHMCTCEVDVETGIVTVLRYVVSEDCGTMINPMVVEGQIAGGVVQGVGGALLEHFVYDADGNPLTSTFLDYLVPSSTDVPTLEYGHIETPSARPGGFKGMGEGGAIGAPAAVFNAVADALAPLGVRLTRQPLSPMAILEALDAAGQQ